jgi:peroxiredoxin
LREKLRSLKQLDAELIAIDPHESYAAKALLKDTGFGPDDVKFPLLMDGAQIVSAMYGVCSQMRIHVEVSNRPATFVIDKSGVIRYEKRGTTFADRPTPDDIVRELKKLN